MSRLIGEDWEGDVRVRFHSDDADGRIHVEHWQDAQPVVDRVQAINSQGAKTLDGLGRPVAEIPMVVLMDYCAKRGIPWEKMAYSNEYDAEFKTMAREYSRLAYEAEANRVSVAR